jgi:hypothetical protein
VALQVLQLEHDPSGAATNVGVPAADEQLLASTDPEGCHIAGDELLRVGPSRDPASAGLAEAFVSGQAGASWIAWS